MAPPKTKAKVGSQRWLQSKKFRTRAGLLIPETINPKPNISPQTKERKSAFITYILLRFFKKSAS